MHMTTKKKTCVKFIAGHHCEPSRLYVSILWKPWDDSWSWPFSQLALSLWRHANLWYVTWLHQLIRLLQFTCDNFHKWRKHNRLICHYQNHVASQKTLLILSILKFGENLEMYIATFHAGSLKCVANSLCRLKIQRTDLSNWRLDSR